MVACGMRLPPRPCSACPSFANADHRRCVVPRAIPIVETMAALCVADAAMAQLARRCVTAAYVMQPT